MTTKCARYAANRYQNTVRGKQFAQSNVTMKHLGEDIIVGIPGARENQVTNIVCKKCSRIYHIRDESPFKNTVKFCPSCGSNDIKVSDVRLDYWKTLSEFVGVNPDVLRQLFVVWDIRENPNFISFVEELKEKVA